MFLRRCFTKALPDDAQNIVRKIPKKIRKKYPIKPNQKHQSLGKQRL
ncbi:hypothetical protein [Pseudomonas frederiksbergensis]|nr:hypothetical protein [Pseudomonas frederiksbergensis]